MKYKLLLICLLAAMGMSDHAVKQTPPNVVLIFFDDLGYGDLSCYGALDMYTPNMDKMAAEGMRFTNFLVAQAVCSASRAALLTGCYPNRLGISGALFPNAPKGLAQSEVTIADMLKQNGYQTAMFGKWHLGDKKDYLPIHQGFDEYFGIPYSNDMWPVNYDGTPATEGNKLQFPTLPLIEGDQMVDSVTTLNDQAQLTATYTKRAISFIDKNKKKPFFLYVAHSMPHVPIAASPKFKGSSKQGLYGDVVQELDWSVGEILESLKKNKLDKNTIVIVTSDNGPWSNFGNHAGSTGGLREGKGTSFEGGHRVPMIIYWPGKIPAGTISNQLASTMDILPSLSKITGSFLPKNKIDGLDISPLFFKAGAETPRKSFYYYYRKNSLEAVRKGNWKLVLAHKGRSYLGQLPGVDGYRGEAPENVEVKEGLYDLRRDPAEQYDVSAANPEIVADLMKMADEARKELGDELTNQVGLGLRISEN